MRVSNTPKRHRSRNNNPRRNNNSQKLNPYENNKENKIKGNAIQVHEKYQSLARDAISSGDIIKAEYYFQHAEHYHRIHKLSQSNHIDKKQKNVVNIHKDKVDEEKDKTKLEEKNDIKIKENILSKNDKVESKIDTSNNSQDK